MNNFNTSTEPADIEVRVNYDTNMSQHNYNENFHVVVQGNRSTRVIQYIEYGNFEKFSESEFKEIQTKTLRKNLLTLARDNCENTYYSLSEINRMNKDELIEFVQEQLMDYMDLEEAQEFADDNSLFIRLDEFDTYESRGYSQGDYVEVLVPHDVASEGLEKDIDNLLWDCEVSIYIEVNAEDLEINQFIDDAYKYDRDEVMKFVKIECNEFKNYDYIVATIEEMLPEYPTYL